MKITLIDVDTDSVLHSLIYFEKCSSIILNQSVYLNHISLNRPNIQKTREMLGDVGTKVGLKSNFVQHFPARFNMFQYVN